MARSIALANKESKAWPCSVRVAARDVAQKQSLGLVECAAIGTQNVVEPDFRFRLGLIVEPAPPGIDRLGLATDEAPVDCADSLFAKDRKLGFESISQASREILGAEKGSLGLCPQLDDQLSEFIGAAVMMEGHDVGLPEL